VSVAAELSKDFAKQSEMSLEHRTYTSSGSTDTSTSAIVCGNVADGYVLLALPHTAIAAGDDYDEREGRQIQIKRLRGRFQIGLYDAFSKIGVDGGHVVRVLVVVRRSNNGATQVLSTDLFPNVTALATYYAMPLADVPNYVLEKYAILHDKTYTLKPSSPLRVDIPPTGTSNDCIAADNFACSYDIPTNFVTTYSSTSDTSCITNAVFAIIIANSSSSDFATYTYPVVFNHTITTDFVG